MKLKKELEIACKKEIVSAVFNPFIQFSATDSKPLFQLNSSGLKHYTENSSELLFPRAANFNSSPANLDRFRHLCIVGTRTEKFSFRDTQKEN